MTAADHHLLFGLLAVRNRLIDQRQLVTAFETWASDKSKSLGDHLEARGDLTGAMRAVLNTLVDGLLQADGGNAEKSFAAFLADESTLGSLAELGEPEIDATLARFTRNTSRLATAAGDDIDADATEAFVPGGRCRSSQYRGGVAVAGAP